MPMSLSLDTVSDSTYRAQEELLFRTTARLKGLFFYRAFNLVTLPVAAWHYHTTLALGGGFWIAFALLILFNLLNVYFAYIGSDCTNRPVWTLLADTLGFTALAGMTGGFESHFIHYYFLLILYSAIWFNRRLSLGVGGATACGLLGLYFGIGHTGQTGQLASALLSVLGLSVGTAEIANLVSRTRERMVSAAMELIQANKQVASQQEAMRKSEERLRLALEGASDGIWDWNFATGQVYFSPRYYEMLGYAYGEFPASYETWKSLLHPDDLATAEAAVKAHIAGEGESFATEFRMRHKHGQWVWILGRGKVVERDPAGNAVRLAGSHTDISERKQAQAELEQLNAELEHRVDQRTHELAGSNRQLKDTLDTLKLAQQELVRSEKLASLGSLVAGVAHELNTPLGNSLTVATTFTDKLKHFATEVQSGALRRSTLNDFVEQAQQATGLLNRNLFTASELINHFKQVAVDQTSAQRRPFDLAETVSEVLLTLQPMFKKTPYRIDVDIPQGILMDSFPGPLGQVLNNLVSNALTHGLAGQPTGNILIAAADLGNQVQLRVSDNGVGISPDDQTRIFDPFFTTRLGQGGSGLGLHIVYSIVTRILGGRIYVASEPGKGATFTLELPPVAPRQTASSMDDAVAISP